MNYRQSTNYYVIIHCHNSCCSISVYIFEMNNKVADNISTYTSCFVWLLGKGHHAYIEWLYWYAAHFCQTANLILEKNLTKPGILAHLPPWNIASICPIFLTSHSGIRHRKCSTALVIKTIKHSLWTKILVFEVKLINDVINMSHVNVLIQSYNVNTAIVYFSIFSLLFLLFAQHFSLTKLR